MARPKKISDEEAIALVAGFVGVHGPGALTFQAAAAATGLSPATLVQRYGSREGLLRAALLCMWDGLDAKTAAADARHELNSAGAIALLVRLSAGYGATAEETAQGLLLLREDFRDPALRVRGVAWGKALALALGRRLTGDRRRQMMLGRLMASQWQGALLWWGFSREGSLRSYIRRELRDWCTAVLGDSRSGGRAR
jgi:AcrR family transcriptional regulator